MQTVAVFVAILAAVSANAVQYVVPNTYNGAVVTSQRLGGNFAYTINQQPSVYSGLQYQVPVNSQVVKSAVPAVSAYTVPAATYKTVAGVPAVSPLGYYSGLNGYNGLGYNGLGYNGLGYNGVYNTLGYNGVYNPYGQVAY